MIVYFNTFMMINYIEIYKLSKAISQHISRSYIYMEQSDCRNVNNYIRGYVHKSEEEYLPQLLIRMKATSAKQYISSFNLVVFD